MQPLHIIGEYVNGVEVEGLVAGVLMDTGFSEGGKNVRVHL